MGSGADIQVRIVDEIGVMTTLIFGASSGVGRALCRELAAAGHDLVILARDLEDLEAEAAHCRLAYGVKVDSLAIDASDPIDVHERLSEEVRSGRLVVKNLIFTIGSSNMSDQVAGSPGNMTHLVNVNLISVMTAVSALLPHLISAGSGNIVLFGSIAAVRGRHSNVAYAAAKRALESYFESLRHSLAATDVRVQFYRLGYVATRQTYGKELLFPIARPETIASHVFNSLDSDNGPQNLPRFWSLVGVAVRYLPWPIFRRLNF
jgi:short-subunit dehydrogenase